MKLKLVVLFSAIFFNHFLHAQKVTSLEVTSSSTQIAQDVGHKANTAFKKSQNKQAVVTLSDGGEIKSTIVVGVGQTLALGSGVWVCSASPCITLDNDSQVIGAGIFRSRLLLAKGSAGPVIQSKGYSSLSNLSEEEALKRTSPLLGDSKKLPGVKYIKIQGLTIHGQKKVQSNISNGIELYGLWFWIEDVSIEHFKGNGLVTQFIPGATVAPDGNDAMESYFTRIKLLSNYNNGWLMKGPHDSIATGVIAANNGDWGIDVLHKEGHYSGGGLMITNSHLYGNKDGLRTESGANIIASNLEAEANLVTGLLLRSNDNIIQGIFYANGKYGIQIGDAASSSGANMLTVQVHNNKHAQVHWANSAGYNFLTGVIFPNDDKQKSFEHTPSLQDQVLTTGPSAVQQISGGIKIDSDRNIYGGKMK